MKWLSYWLRCVCVVYTVLLCCEAGGHLLHCCVQVQSYETEHEKFSDWLNEKKRDVSAFGPVPATPDAAKEELVKLQVLHCMTVKALTGGVHFLL